MKVSKRVFSIIGGSTLVAAGVFAAMAITASAAEDEAIASGAAVATAAAGSNGSVVLKTNDGEGPKTIIRRVAARYDAEHRAAHRDVPWLGVSTAEGSEALTAQLRLKPGVGLVVEYIAPKSPAATAGLENNDVLVEFEGQSLVHPEQLRKLVRVLKPNEEVKLVYYRAGKRQTVSVTLGKAPPGLESPDGEGLPRRYGLFLQPEELGPRMALRDQLGALKLDQGKLRQDIRRSMEQAEKAVQEALKNTTNAGSSWDSALKHYKALAHSGITVDKNATVIVRNAGKAAKSVVKTDDSGTIVLINKPRLRLTAHDEQGKLVFDGEIETPEQRDKVPRDLWERVEPLLDKVGPAPTEEPGAEDAE